MNHDRIMTPAALAALAKGDMANALIAATPGGIEAQEAAGQSSFVNSTSFPIEMEPGREAFEAIGFKFGDSLDTLFLACELPAGWTKAVTDHAMHSVIVDEQRRKRVAIFYKAAFYDRRASANMLPRYAISRDYGDLSPDLGIGADQCVATLRDGGKLIKKSEPWLQSDFAAGDDHILKMRAAFEAEYPNWRNPTAYW